MKYCHLCHKPLPYTLTIYFDNQPVCSVDNALSANRCTCATRYTFTAIASPKKRQEVPSAFHTALAESELQP
jgi:hypothetical protein